MTAVIRAGALRGYCELVRELAGRPERLLKECRIHPSSLDDEDTLVPLHAHVRLLETTAQALRVGDFGMRLGRRQDIGILGPLSLAMQHARNVAEALQYASRRLFVQSQAVGFSVVQHGKRPSDPVELRIEFVEGRLGTTRQFMDQCLAVLDRVSAFLGQDRYRLLSISLDHTPQVAANAYQRAFGARVLVAQAHAGLMVESRFLSTPLHGANKVLQKMAVDYIETHYAGRDQLMSSRVRLILSRSLGAVAATRAYVADTLALNVRTLQRQLEREGTSFDAIRDEVRKQNAFHYLQESQLPMAQIAGLVGLSQASALTRCCLRWFGRTPTAIRESWVPLGRERYDSGSPTPRTAP
jgi:AraC-like DNA-binding protein